MTERIRALLDGVADGAGPRTPDPVGAVLRRHRDQRRRHLARSVAAGLATLALLLGGVAMLRTSRLAPVESSPAARPSLTVATLPAAGGPVRPRLVGDRVVAAGFTLPVPAGWTVVQDREQQVCDTASATLLIDSIVIPGGRCPDISLIHVDAADPAFVPEVRPHEVPYELVLPGGQPGWLQFLPLDQITGPARRAALLTVPWSGVRLTVEGTGDEVRQILDTVRTEPVTPSRLVLPSQVNRLVFVPAGQAGHLSVERRDEATVRQVLALLATLTDVVGGDAGCRSTDRPAALTLSGAGGKGTTLLISSSDGCEQATSALGGRVRLPAGFLARLTALLEEPGR